MTAGLKRFRHVAAAAPLMLALIATASAQAPYPNRNITLVLPFAAISKAHGFFRTDATAGKIKHLIFAYARRRCFVLHLGAVVVHFDIWKSIGATRRTNQHRIAL